ncbi:MAG: hypothetical protein OEU84_07610 [Xanthomonadales bacterium]|jgi:hypothetical protein|nr:hypothetical protein [Xanthomonadales bacterium]MDH4019451.1 hypothetical protein [Xanthomonadales bacterium]
MKSSKILLAMISVGFAISASAGTPSAKFAAVYGDGGPYVVSTAVITDATEDTVDSGSNSGYTFATIKVPQDKELLIGVSAEVGLTTDTSIKGKNGGTAKSIAGAAGFVEVCALHAGTATVAACAAPGPVTLSSRIQTLSATLGGVIENCEDLNGDGVIDVKTECAVTDEEIGLMLDTVASHHFNFVLPNMDQGEYDITAYFMTTADVAVDIDEVSVEEGGTVTGSAYANAFIGKYMVTVQQVRAVKGSILDVDIIE